MGTVIDKPLSIREQAANELAKEKAEKAKEAIKAKLRALDGAKAVVANIEREIQDLEQQISDGSF
jgi:predicted  nucleic acid-binding Zn-ribbon protein